jgi:hypothetical protein
MMMRNRQSGSRALINQVQVHRQEDRKRHVTNWLSSITGSSVYKSELSMSIGGGSGCRGLNTNISGILPQSENCRYLY